MNHDPDNPQPESLPPQGTFISGNLKERLAKSLKEVRKIFSFKCHRVDVEGCEDPHATVALSAYHIANMLSAIHQHPSNGDWWWDVQYKLREAHIAIGEPELYDNEGRHWEFTDGTPGGMLFTVIRHHNGTEWIDGP